MGRLFQVSMLRAAIRALVIVIYTRTWNEYWFVKICGGIQLSSTDATASGTRSKRFRNAATKKKRSREQIPNQNDLHIIVCTDNCPNR